MGKGDPRTRKGKIFRGSFGNSRPHKIEKSDAPAAPDTKPEAKAEKPKRARKPAAA